MKKTNKESTVALPQTLLIKVRLHCIKNQLKVKKWVREVVEEALKQSK